MRVRLATQPPFPLSYSISRSTVTPAYPLNRPAIAHGELAENLQAFSPASTRGCRSYRFATASTNLQLLQVPGVRAAHRQPRLPPNPPTFKRLEDLERKLNTVHYPLADYLVGANRDLITWATWSSSHLNKLLAQWHGMVSQDAGCALYS